VTVAGRPKRLFLPVLCALLALLFAGLGVWQVERLWWKLDLIERIDRRLAAAPVAVPPASAWASLDPRDIEYRRVRAEGVFDSGRTTLVDALTERGSGNWVLTPLRTKTGIILVNRGFAPKDWKPDAGGGERQVVAGLLRLTEPEGRVLRPNRPAADTWYSRDVAAIVNARGLTGVAPFFIDADAARTSASFPIGGMTVVHFRNAHLVYALTWFGLAGLCVFGLVLTLRTTHNSG
jgi:surfeit locus 1 family protein